MMTFRNSYTLIILLMAATAFGQNASEKKQAGNEQLSQPELIEKSYPLDSGADRTKSVDYIQQLTVDLLALSNQFKEVHWNVTGPLYLSLHEFFDTQADYYNEQADIFAERALHLGYSIDGRFSTIARTTKLPGLPAGFMSDNESLRWMIARVTVLQKGVYEYILETEKTDAVTSNKLQDLAYNLDKSLWQMRIHLQKPGADGQSLPWSGK